MKKLLCLLIGFCIATPVYGGLWDAGGTDNLWSTVENWEGDSFPIDVDAVITYLHSQNGTELPVIQTGIAADAGTMLLGDLGGFDWGDGPVTLTMTGGSLTVNRSAPAILGDFKMGRVDFANHAANGDPFVSVETNHAFFDISDGTVFAEGALFLGEGSSATVNQTGGDISVNAVLINAFDTGVADAFAQYNLDGGTLHVRNENDFHMWQNSNFDLAFGVLTIVGDRRDVLNVFIDDGRMTAFDGTGIVSLSYDAAGNLTTVRGIIPEPATVILGLLLAASLAIARRL